MQCFNFHAGNLSQFLNRREQRKRRNRFARSGAAADRRTFENELRLSAESRYDLWKIFSVHSVASCSIPKNQGDNFFKTR
jgi:hypothetical protein